MLGTKNKNNSYRNKNNTLHYGPGWGSSLPLQFLPSGGDHANLRLAIIVAQKNGKKLHN